MNNGSTPGITRRRTCNIDTLPWFYSSRIWANTVQLRVRSEQGNDYSGLLRTFGAVVLTLKATGCPLLFVTLSVRLTSTVSGPNEI